MKDIEAYLNQIPMWAAKKNSLEDIRCYLDKLGNPDTPMKIIHVAGTNGKGSVCKFLTSVLAEAGYHVGTFVSPHLEETRERFLLDGDLIDVDMYKAAFEKVLQLSDTMTRQGYHPPTYFEFLFYMFMVINDACKPDFVILETGLGGRLDVTNVIQNPVMTIITSISLEHMEYLGNTTKEIALEKAGILKPGVPVVYDSNDLEASESIRKRADDLQCPQIPVGKHDFKIIMGDGEKTSISVREFQGSWFEADVRSIAEYQLMNAALAITALGYLGEEVADKVTTEMIQTGIEGSYWSGRMEQALPGVYLDGAHNIGGIEALASTIKRLQEGNKKAVYLLFAVVSDKDYSKMIQVLCEHISPAGIFIANMETERGIETGTLVPEFQKYVFCPIKAFDSVEEAFHQVLSIKTDDDMVFCIGSLYLIGEIKQILRRNEDD